MISRLKPRRSAQRSYMRMSISAQSCDSVPPAPGWMMTSAPSRSCSPESRLLVSSAATCCSSAPSSRSSSASMLSSASDSARSRSSPRLLSELDRAANSSTVRFRCLSRVTVFCASSGRSQNPGAVMRCSSSAPSRVRPSTSKIPPQVAEARRDRFEALAEFGGGGHEGPCAGNGDEREARRRFPEPEDFSMRATHLCAAAVLLVTGAAFAGAPMTDPLAPVGISAKPANAPARPVTETLWGQKVTDNYRYMEALDPKTLAWMKSEGAYTRKVLDAIGPRAALEKKIAAFTASFGFVQGYAAYGGRAFYEERAPGSDNFDLM